MVFEDNAENEFSFFDIKYEFDDAEAFCNGIGGMLIEPRDDATMIDVTNHAKSVDITNFWLGIHDKYAEGTFVYASDNSTIEWSNWAPGQPGNNPTGDDCVQTLANGKWRNVPCEGFERSIICMKGSNQ